MKCYKGTLVLYDRSRHLTVYSFHQNGEDECELDRFFTRLIDPRHETDINIILAVYNEFKQRGIRPGRFRPQGEGKVEAIAKGDGNLRLYCIPLGHHLIIYGNGGEKTSRRTQDSPDCRPHWELMEKIEEELLGRILAKEVYYTSVRDEYGEYDELSGNLYFEIDCD